jgi:hypothetical protein
MLPPVSSLEIRSPAEGVFLQFMLHFFRTFSMSDETKISVFPRFLETTRKDLLAKMETEEEHNKIKKLWGDLETWGRICQALENPSYEIAGKDLSDPENLQLFSQLCEQWTELFKNRNREQYFAMEKLGGFRYSLAIMLINAPRLFGGNWQPLQNLWMTVYERVPLDFTNPEIMKAKVMEIMESASNYDLAYMYLGNGE